jgi:hypothetical protein
MIILAVITNLRNQIINPFFGFIGFTAIYSGSYNSFKKGVLIAFFPFDTVKISLKLWFEKFMLRGLTVMFYDFTEL